ncbi:POT family-domain-containing protein, partial [Chytriomyces sp. MP71]
MLYHVFIGFAYLTPLVGALLSDSFLDKYKTITSLSLVYILGLLILTVTSWPTLMGVETTKLRSFGPLLGLALVCIGTGGIKPCVSAHGGDQFLEIQSAGLTRFYNYFYVAINVGAVVSSYASPAVAKWTLYAFPNDTLASWEARGLKPDIGNGYPVAWLMLLLSMSVALAVFVSGFKTYRVVPPAGRFILWDHACVAISYAWHWFCGGRGTAYVEMCRKYGEDMVEEMLDLAQVMFALTPAPIFWMAFSMNGSTFQDMGDQMRIPFGGDAQTSFFDSETTNNVWNPIFVVILAPLMANIVYPFIERRFGTNSFPLMSRMAAGQVLAGIAYIFAALLQRSINAHCANPHSHPDICTSSLPTLLLIPLYLLLTQAEILFSISGLHFSYTEVGRRTKSVCSALWLLTSSGGSFLAAWALGVTMESAPEVWTRERFFWGVSGLCFLSAAAQWGISRVYVRKLDRKSNRALSP